MSQSGQAGEKKKNRLLTREQQAIWRRDNRGAMKGKSKDERKAAREKGLSELEAMSESDRAKFAKDLQTKWDALSESEKQALKKKGKEGRKGGGGGGKKKRKKGGAGAGAADDDD